MSSMSKWTLFVLGLVATVLLIFLYLCQTRDVALLVPDAPSSSMSNKSIGEQEIVDRPPAAPAPPAKPEIPRESVPPPISDQSLCGRIAGTVRWADGRPISGAHVFCTKDQDDPNSDPGFTRIRSKRVFTKTDGRFSFDALPLDRHLVQAFLKDDFKEQPVALDTASTEAEISIVFPARATILGSVVGSDGKPVAKARIYLAAKGSRSRPKIVSDSILGELKRSRDVWADELGQYKVEGLPPGEIVIRIMQTGYLGIEIMDLQLSEGEVRAITSILKFAPVITGTIVLSESVVSADKAREALSSGRAFVKMYVYKRLQKGHNGYRLDSVPIGIDGKFEYEINRLWDEHTLYIYVPGYRPVWKNIQLEAEETKTLELVLDDKGGHFSGSIRFKSDVENRPKVSVQVLNHEKNKMHLWEPMIYEINSEGLFNIDGLDFTMHSFIFKFGSGFGQKRVTIEGIPDMDDVVVEEP